MGWIKSPHLRFIMFQRLCPLWGRPQWSLKESHCFLENVRTYYNSWSSACGSTGVATQTKIYARQPSHTLFTSAGTLMLLSVEECVTAGSHDFSAFCPLRKPDFWPDLIRSQPDTRKKKVMSVCNFRLRYVLFVAFLSRWDLPVHSIVGYLAISQHSSVCLWLGRAQLHQSLFGILRLWSERQTIYSPRPCIWQAEIMHEAIPTVKCLACLSKCVGRIRFHHSCVATLQHWSRFCFQYHVWFVPLYGG